MQTTLYGKSLRACSFTACLITLAACDNGFTDQDMPLVSGTRIPYTGYAIPFQPDKPQSAQHQVVQQQQQIVYIPMYVDPVTGARTPVTPIAKPVPPVASYGSPSYNVAELEGDNGW